MFVREMKTSSSLLSEAFGSCLHHHKKCRIKRCKLGVKAGKRNPSTSHLGNKNFRDCFPFGDKLGSLDVECSAGEGPEPLGAAGPGASDGFLAFELFLELLVAFTLGKPCRPSCPSTWQK